MKYYEGCEEITREKTRDFQAKMKLGYDFKKAYDRQPERAAGRGNRRDPAFSAARDPDCCRQKRAHEHGGDRAGPEREVRRNHEREKEPAAGHSPGDGADRL